MLRVKLITSCGTFNRAVEHNMVVGGQHTRSNAPPSTHASGKKGADKSTREAARLRMPRNADKRPTGTLCCAPARTQSPVQTSCSERRRAHRQVTGTRRHTDGARNAGTVSVAPAQIQVQGRSAA